MDKSTKRLFVKKKKSIRRSSPLIQFGDQIDYKNGSLLLNFVTREGKNLPRRVNKLTLKQQRLITIAIKQARILSLLPFVNSSKFVQKQKNVKKMQKASRLLVLLLLVLKKRVMLLQLRINSIETQSLCGLEFFLAWLIISFSNSYEFYFIIQIYIILPPSRSSVSEEFIFYNDIVGNHKKKIPL